MEWVRAETGRPEEGRASRAGPAETGGGQDRMDDTLMRELRRIRWAAEAAAENREAYCRRHGIAGEHFYPYLCGRLMGELRGLTGENGKNDGQKLCGADGWEDGENDRGDDRGDDSGDGRGDDRPAAGWGDGVRDGSLERNGREGGDFSWGAAG